MKRKSRCQRAPAARRSDIKCNRAHWTGLSAGVCARLIHCRNLIIILCALLGLIDPHRAIADVFSGSDCTATLSGGPTFTSFARVGFRENAVAYLRGTLNGQPDLTANDFQVQINWGDDDQWTDADLVLLSGGTFQVKGSHVYTTLGKYTVQAKATGPCGITDGPKQTSSVTVVQMPSGIPGTRPDATGSPPARDVTVKLLGGPTFASFDGVGFRENVVAYLSGTLNGQPDLAINDFQAQINWGDDDQWSPADLVLLPNGTFLVKGSHVYTRQQGRHPVVVYAYGPDGTSTALKTSDVTVYPMPSGIQGAQPAAMGSPPPRDVSVTLAGGTTYNAEAGVELVAGTIARLSGTLNGQPDKTLTDFSVQINWGDDDKWWGGQKLSSGGLITISGSHTYTTPGTYPVVVYVNGPDGTSTAMETSSVTVSPGPPTPPPVSEPNPPPENPRASLPPIFHFYYINGINTPRFKTSSFGPASRPGNDPGGNYNYEFNLVKTKLVDYLNADPLIPGGQYMMGEHNDKRDWTYNPSGKESKRLLRSQLAACRTQSGEAWNLICSMAEQVEDFRSGKNLGQQAPGDLFECFVQAIKSPAGGPPFASNQAEARNLANKIKKIYARELRESEKTRRPHYFIIVAHSQGNFFAEGVVYQLAHDVKQGKMIVDTRLGVVALASPTTYDSLPQPFQDTRLKHVTRADDGINILNPISSWLSTAGMVTGHPIFTKHPWPRSSNNDAPALWAWKDHELDAFDNVFDVLGVGKIWSLMNLMNENKTVPLTTPFMNSHLIDNYLTDPTATPSILTVNDRSIPPNVATMLQNPIAISGGFLAPDGIPVLSIVRGIVSELQTSLFYQN